MKLAIVGSRNFNYYVLLKETILHQYNINSIEMIVSGGAFGADSLAQRFAKEFGLPILIYYPNWDKYGKIAGFARNKQIIDAADDVCAFQVNKSKGTQNSIDYAREKKKSVFVVELKEEDNSL